MLLKTIEIPVGNMGTVSVRAFCPQPDSACPQHFHRPGAVICPGGGYQRRDFNEDEPVALALAARGVNAFVVDYHVAPCRFPRPQQDAGAAIHYLKTHAADYWLDQDRIALMGFSSGGHLAASVGVMGSRTDIWNRIGLDWKKDVRPHALVLCYPVITAGPYAHRNSFIQLTGSENPEDHAALSLETLVSAETPPTFLWHTWTDEIVPVQNSLLFASALTEYHVKTELHIYPEGPHGVSLANNLTADPNTNPGMIVPDVQGWFDLAVRFIKSSPSVDACDPQPEG